MSVNKASLLVCLRFVNQSGANASELVSSSSAYDTLGSWHEDDANA